MFIANPDADNIGDAILVLASSNAAIKLRHWSRLTYTYINKNLCGLGYCIETSGLPIKILIRDTPILCLK